MSFVLTSGTVREVSGGNIEAVNTVSTRQVSTSTISVNGSGGVVLQEQATGNISDTGSGKGRLWVRNDAPSVPVFRDDTGVDHALYGESGSGGESLAQTLTIGNDANNQSIVGVSNMRFYTGVVIGGGTNPASIPSYTDVAIGDNATIGAAALCSVAVGANTSVTAGQVNCVAVGFGASCGVEYAVAIGYGTSAAGSGSICIGDIASSTHQEAICIGRQASSSAVNTLNINVSGSAQGNSGSISTDLVEGAKGGGVQALPANAAFLTVTIGGTVRRLQVFNTA